MSPLFGTFAANSIRSSTSLGPGSTVKIDNTFSSASLVSNPPATLSYPFTVNRNPYRTLVVSVAGESISNNNAVVSTITYNGVALQRAVARQNLASGSIYGNIEIWYMLNPPVGTNTLTTTFIGPSPGGYSVAASALFNTAQIPVTGGLPYVETSLTVSALSQSVQTFHRTAMIIDVFYHPASTATDLSPANGQTELYDEAGAACRIAGGARIVSGSGPVINGWTYAPNLASGQAALLASVVIGSAADAAF